MLRVVDRLCALLFLLLLLGAALVTLALASGLLAAAAVPQIWPYAPADSIARDLAGLGSHVGAPVLGGAAAAAVLALLLIIADLRPAPRRERLLVVPTAGPGRTEVDFGALDELAQHSAEQIAGIERARARVLRERRGLVVRCRALVSPYVSVAETGSALETALAADLARVTGLPVRGVRVRTTVQAERARRRVR